MEALWGLIGAIVGAAASIGTTWLTNQHNAKLQQDSDAQERQERMRAFQRETLIDLQDAFHDAIRLAAQAHLETVIASRASGEWSRLRLPEELSEKQRIANRRVMLLVERVADDSVRLAVKGVMSDANAIAFASTKESAQATLDQVTFDSVSAIETIGETLRGQY